MVKVMTQLYPSWLYKEHTLKDYFAFHDDGFAMLWRICTWSSKIGPFEWIWIWNISLCQLTTWTQTEQHDIELVSKNWTTDQWAVYCITLCIRTFVYEYVPGSCPIECKITPIHLINNCSRDENHLWPAQTKPGTSHIGLFWDIGRI